jgi:Cytochrome oxidase complex assembly protein 1
VLNLDKIDKLMGTTFKVVAVLYVLAITFQRTFRPDVYEMVSVPLQVLLVLTLVFIGARWVLTKFGFSYSGSTKINRRAAVKAFAAVAALIFLSAGLEYLYHNFSLTQQATGILQASRDGEGALGDPIRLGWIITGNTRIGRGEGTANLSIPVKGSKASGELEVKGIKKDGSWHVVDLYLIMDGNGAVVKIPH